MSSRLGPTGRRAAADQEWKPTRHGAPLKATRRTKGMKVWSGSDRTPYLNQDFRITQRMASKRFTGIPTRLLADRPWYRNPSIRPA